MKFADLELGYAVQLDDREPAVDMDAVVVPGAQELTIVFTYPLTRPSTLTLQADSAAGFTRGYLLTAIRRTYRRIYKEEWAYRPPASPTGAPATPAYVNLLGFPSGPHGIWGHHLGDLVLRECRQPSDARLPL